MIKLILAWIKGGKTNTAMISLVVVYCLNKYLGIVTDETQIAATLAILLGALGQIHKVYKSELVTKVIANLKRKEVVEIKLNEKAGV